MTPGLPVKTFTQECPPPGGATQAGCHMLRQRLYSGLTESEGLSDHPDQEQARELNRSSRVFQRDMMPDDLIGTLLFLPAPTATFSPAR